MFSYPLQVDIDITERCNFNCKYCTASTRKNIDDELTTKEFEQLILEMYEWGVLNFNIAGGEPLIKPNILQLLHNISLLKGIDITVVTNGSIVNDSTVEFFKTHSNIHLLVSLDSYFNEINEITRSQTNLVKKNISRLIQEGVDITISQVITDRSIESFWDNLLKLQEMGIKSLLVIKYIASGGGMDAKDEAEIPYERWKEFLIKLTKFKSTGKFSKIGVSTACPWEIYLPLFDARFSVDDIYSIWNYKSPLLMDRYKEVSHLGCHAGVTSMNILANGDVMPCSVAGNEAQLVCGNVKEQSIKDIWENSPLLNQLRKTTVEQLNGNCGKCDTKEVCGGGCRLRAYFRKKNIYDKDYICPKI